MALEPTRGTSVAMATLSTEGICARRLSDIADDDYGARVGAWRRRSRRRREARQIDAQREDVLGIVAGMQGGELLDAANHQARAHQQEHGEGDFGDHQRAAEAASAAMIGGVAGGLLERIVEVAAGDLRGGSEPEKQTDGTGDRAR